MTTVDRSARAVDLPSSAVGMWVVPAAAGVAVLCRLPFLGMAAGQDEAGFLLVAKQWRAGGASLYGNYWVDRPPLLIGVYQLGSMFGGLPALRLIGCVAVALTVLGSALAARQLAGRAASPWAAVTAAALSATPLLGSLQINGELLASPFIALGITAVVTALRSTDQRPPMTMAALAGAAGAAAMLVKQNFAEVAVFAVVAYVVAWRRHEQPTQWLVRLVVCSLAGGVAVVVFTAAWAQSKGTSLSGVFYALYPFRVHAGQVMAAGSQYALDRLQNLLEVAAVSGLAPLLVLVAVRARPDRKVRACWHALLVTIAFGTASVLLGGNYWTHYLLELVSPIAVAVGVMAARKQQALVRGGVALVALSAALAWAIALTVPQGSVGTTVGRAIGSAAHPNDTIVTAYGHADVVETSGLASPYPYLWSLPVKTLDPQLTDLDHVLSGRARPTWLVSWDDISSWGLTSGHATVAVARHYHQVAMICGRTIYLRNGVDRPAPVVRDCPPGFDIASLRGPLS
jgi:hypothetical protein